MSRTRLPSIDLLRGAVMIIMALDHIRDFFHVSASYFSPDDLTHTTAALFFTRWITHFCAPVFMFTAGLGAFIREQHGHNKADMSKFLLTRGLWLVILEMTVLRFGFQFDFTYGPLLLTILWALGWCMVALAALIHLPMRVLTGVSLAMIALHNLLDPIGAKQFGAWEWLWHFLHQPGPFAVGGVTVIVGYPVIPWIGVMAAGYCLGPVFQMEASRRRKLLLRLGLALTAAFLLLRSYNHYGDRFHWSHQATPLFTILSFLGCTKYPPSLDFLLMTLGPALIVLSLLDRVRVGPRNPVLVFGRVPLFYFLLHIYLLHFIAMLLAYFRYGTAWFLLKSPPSMGTPLKLYPPHYGYDLWATYAVWIVVVAVLYPLCVWFAELKQRRRDGWLSYL